jgi:hypothetical protein
MKVRLFPAVHGHIADSVRAGLARVIAYSLDLPYTCGGPSMYLAGHYR